MPSVITAVLCVALLKVCVVSSTPKAAIYIDNGHDQTAIDRLMTQDEKKEMELEILNLLGLPNRPRKINRSPLKKSAPRFLLDIYRSLMEDENDENNRAKRSTDLNFSGEEQQQIDQSDVIMTFEGISKLLCLYLHFFDVPGPICVLFFLIEQLNNIQTFVL